MAVASRSEPARRTGRIAEFRLQFFQYHVGFYGSKPLWNIVFVLFEACTGLNIVVDSANELRARGTIMTCSSRRQIFPYE